ncbi:MAG: asparagine synthase-related protein [Halobacteriales archaeon]
MTGGRFRGADPALAERALSRADPLPGATADAAVRGFAGELPDGRLVRDVLGREPLYVDGDEWAFAPDDLDDPRLLPAGTVRDADGTSGRLSLSAPDPETDERAAVDRLTTVLDGALEATPPTAVAFSGGVDSSLVAAGTDGPLYAVGFPGSHDLVAARDAARAFDRDLRVVELDADDLREAVPVVARATGRTNAMDVSIAVPLYAAARRAAADGHDRIALGQGADELFGGYAKVAKAPGDPRVDAETVRGARRETLATLPDQLPRDVLAVRAGGARAVAPLLDDRVIAAALELPERLLVDGRGERKVGLRQAARSFVPARVAYREKKAVQYGSLIARELDRLARQAGFKRRQDDHLSKYVASLL